MFNVQCLMSCLWGLFYNPLQRYKEISKLRASRVLKVINNPALLRNKRGLLENKRGLLSDRGRFADIADMLTLISKSNTKKIKKGILAIYPFLINLWKLMSACQQCQRLEDFRMAQLVDFRL